VLGPMPTNPGPTVSFDRGDGRRIVIVRFRSALAFRRPSFDVLEFKKFLVDAPDRGRKTLIA
jgi:hypothetical protein